MCLEFPPVCRKQVTFNCVNYEWFEWSVVVVECLFIWVSVREKF